MRLLSVLVCLVEAFGGSVAVLLAMTVRQCSVAEMKAEFDWVRRRCVNKSFFIIDNETHLSAGVGSDSCQMRFRQVTERCYNRSDTAVVRVIKLADKNIRSGTRFIESCEQNMSLNNVCMDDDTAVYMVMGCADSESPRQAEPDEGFDEAKCDEVLAEVAFPPTPGGVRITRFTASDYFALGVGVGLTLLKLLVTALERWYRTRRASDQETTTGTTTAMDSSQQLSGVTTIIRDFMEGETVAEQTNLNSDGSRMAMVDRPVEPAVVATTPV